MAHREKEVFEEILCKFIVNLPAGELQDVNRLSYHAEKAFYFYMDEVVRDKEKDLRKEEKERERTRNEFFLKLKEHAPPFLRINPVKLAAKLQENKPTCGAIVFNREETKVLIVRVKAKFGFPKGKVNQGETVQECAAREVQEETGVYIHDRLDPRVRIEFESHGASCCFLVARGVSEDARIRKEGREVDGIFWMWVEDIKNNFYMFTEKSREAWRMFLKVQQSAPAPPMPIGEFIHKYAPGGEEAAKQQDLSVNPFLDFRFNREKLKGCLVDL